MAALTPPAIRRLPSITKAHETYYDLMINSPRNSTPQDKMAKLVQSLFENGLKANGIDKKGNPPLHLAARFGYIYIVNNLLYRGADPEVKDRNGLTPIEVINDVFKQIESNPEVEIFNAGVISFCRNAISRAIEEQNSH